MIKSFKNTSLKKLYNGDPSKVNPDHRERINNILAYLNSAKIPDDMSIAGLNLHQLTGNRKGFWAVKVSGNYRIWFRFEDLHVWDVDYGDYH